MTMITFIPTPIGNTQDITLRALDCMRSYSVFFCEDTRTTKKLFNIYEISLAGKQFIPLPQWSEPNKLSQLHQILITQDCGIMSEAGTPGLSDPGKQMVQYAYNHSIPLEVLPGANALIPAIVSTPTDTSNFVYLGFAPAKKGRKTFFKSASGFPVPVYFFESVHRIEKTLKDLGEIGYTGRIRISREISKKFEQHIDGTADYLLQAIKDGLLPLKGEFVICLY